MDEWTANRLYQRGMRRGPRGTVRAAGLRASAAGHDGSSGGRARAAAWRRAHDVGADFKARSIGCRFYQVRKACSRSFRDSVLRLSVNLTKILCTDHSSCISMAVITTNGGPQPWAIQGSFTERPDQMSLCPSLAWGGCGDRGGSRTARLEHPAPYFDRVRSRGGLGIVQTSHAGTFSCGNLFTHGLYFPPVGRRE